jgi:hypothetical protein
MNYGGRNYGGKPPLPRWAQTTLAVVGCLVVLPLVIAVTIGLPIVIFHGLTSGDWGWAILWAIGAAVAVVLGKLGMIPVIND